MEKFGEKILFSRLKNKDKEAFIRAYDSYLDNIYRFIYFKIGGEEEAQDLTSVVFLKAWNHIQNNSLLDYKTLKALFYKIARNSIIDYYRERASIKEVAGGEDALTNIVDETQDLARKTELTFDLAKVNEKIHELKDEYREIIVLRFMEDFSISEIAEITDKTNGNVRVLVYRALKALRELMGE